MVIVHVLVSLRLQASWDFFSKDRMAPPKKSFNSSSTRKCNFIEGKKNNQTKKPQEFVWKFIHAKHMKLKYPRQPGKKTIIVS